jgi:hypothetical protein
LGDDFGYLTISQNFPSPKYNLLRDMGDPIRTIRPIWMFPEMRVLPNHPFIDGIFDERNHPAMGYLCFWKPPYLYNQHIDALSKKTQVHTMLIPDFLGWLFILVIVQEVTPTKTSQKTSEKKHSRHFQTHSEGLLMPSGTWFTHIFPVFSPILCAPTLAGLGTIGHQCATAATSVDGDDLSLVSSRAGDDQW